MKYELVLEYKYRQYSRSTLSYYNVKKVTGLSGYRACLKYLLAWLNPFRYTRAVLCCDNIMLHCFDRR